ncbi:FAD synthase [Mycoplasma corogypsi]|uniref:FAD synthase n=1 Tax=Mycoplasma corogypsi TaxID=2106 RepID=UPI0038739094
MAVYSLLDFIAEENDNFLIGSFESFHIGHYQLYRELMAQKQGRKFIVVFSLNSSMDKFTDHIFTDDNARYTKFAELDIDGIIELDFISVAGLEAKEFLNKLTQNKKTKIIVGEDFRFGKGANTTASEITSLNPNITCIIKSIYKVTGLKLGTKRLKETLEFGQVSFVNDLLVWNYTFSCQFQSQNEIITHPKLAIMHKGVYAVFVHVDGFAYYALMHINFDGKRIIYLIDEENSFIKEKTIGLIEVVKEVRLIANKKYDLIAAEDVLEAKTIFKEYI